MKRGILIVVLGLFLIFFSSNIIAFSFWWSPDKEVYFSNSDDNFKFSADRSTFSIFSENSLKSENISIHIRANSLPSVLTLQSSGEFIGVIDYFNNTNQEYRCDVTGYFKDDIEEWFSNNILRFSGTGFCREKTTGDISMCNLHGIIRVDSNCEKDIQPCSVIDIDTYAHSFVSLDIFFVNHSIQDYNQNIILQLYDNNLSNLNNNFIDLKNSINICSINLSFYKNITDNQEKRILALENQTSPTPNGTPPNYFKYLSSSDRKNIVCGYAEDNHLNQLTDLGWNCIVTYRQTSRGETSSCRCKAVK